MKTSPVISLPLQYISNRQIVHGTCFPPRELRRTGGCGMAEGTREFRRFLELQRHGGCQPTVLTNSLHGEFSWLNSDHALLVLKQDQRSAYWVFGFPEDLEICLMWLWVEDRAILEVWWAEKGSKHNVRIWQNSKTSCQDLLPSLLNPCAYSKKQLLRIYPFSTLCLI